MNKEFVFTRKVRFGDCDPGGVLYTPRIGYFVVEAVLDFISACLKVPAEKGILELGVLPPARSLKVDFLKPMAWDDDVEIHVSLKQIGRSSMVFSVNGFVLANKVFEAEIAQVCVNPESKLPVSVPTKLREALEKYRSAT